MHFYVYRTLGLHSKTDFVLQLLIKQIFEIYSLHLSQCVTCCLLNYLCNLCSQNSFKVKPTPFIVDAKTLTPVNMSQDVFILESLFLLTL